MEMNDKTARTLAIKYDEWWVAERPKVREVRRARLDGACEAIHAMGLGQTPTAVMMWVKDAYDKHGAMPAFTAYNEDRKEWFRVMERDIIINSINA